MFNQFLYNRALFNQAAVTGKLYPSGISQTVAIGVPVLKYPRWLYPSGIDQVIAVGSPILRYPQWLYPSGVGQVVAIGSLVVIVTPLIRLYIAGTEVTGQVQLADFMIENRIDGVSTSTVRIL